MAWIEKNKKIILFLILPTTMAVLIALEVFVSAAYGISLTIFFFVPVSLTIWGVGKREGIFVLIVSVFLIFIIHVLKARPSNALSHYWHLSSQSIILFIVALILIALKNSLQKAESLSRTDYLTGAVNARHFYELAGSEKTRAERFGQPLSIVYLDIDNFKEINDAFGHHHGDRLLRKTVETIKSRIRSIDTLARLGGDEFALLLPNAGYKEAHDIIMRIHDSISSNFENNNKVVTFSIGAVTSPAVNHSIEEMINEADRLMYASKLGGKNSFRHEMMNE